MDEVKTLFDAMIEECRTKKKQAKKDALESKRNGDKEDEAYELGEKCAYDWAFHRLRKLENDVRAAIESE